MVDGGLFKVQTQVVESECQSWQTVNNYVSPPSPFLLGRRQKWFGCVETGRNAMGLVKVGIDR